jgi:TRAP-type C4-dicarboxylate transport system permease small subunit
MVQREDRSLGELFSNLANQTSTLVREEVNLARTEMTQKAASLGKDAGMVGAGGVLALGGYLAFIATLIIVLDIWLPLWLSALIVAVLFAGIGFVLIQQGLNAMKRLDLTPRQTIATLKDDAQWAKEQTK